MKKALLTLVCACALTLGTVFAAQAETTGVYVAPKFMMMWQNLYGDFSMSGTNRPTNGDSSSNSQFGVGGALAVGYDFYPQHKLPIRAELEFAIRGNNSKSMDLENRRAVNANATQEAKINYNAKTLLANFYYDFHNDSDFTPYISAGAGLAFINAKYEYNGNNVNVGPGQFADVEVSSTKNFTNFAWTVGAGVAYNFNENVAVDLGYRYLNLGSTKYTDSFAGCDVEAKNFNSNHEIMLGARFTF